MWGSLRLARLDFRNRSSPHQFRVEYLFPRFPGTSVFSARSSGPGSSRLRSLLVVSLCCRRWSFTCQGGTYLLQEIVVVEGWSNSRDKFTFTRPLHYFSLERLHSPVPYTTSHWRGPRCSSAQGAAMLSGSEVLATFITTIAAILTTNSDTDCTPTALTTGIQWI